MKTCSLISILVLSVTLVLFVSCNLSKKDLQLANQDTEHETKKFATYETETYLIVYGEIQHLELKDKQGNIVASENMQQLISTKELQKGETYKLHITAKDGTKAEQSFTKTF